MDSSWGGEKRACMHMRQPLPTKRGKRDTKPGDEAGYRNPSLIPRLSLDEVRSYPALPQALYLALSCLPYFVGKGWHNMRMQWLPDSPFPSPRREPGDQANCRLYSEYSTARLHNRTYYNRRYLRLHHYTHNGPWPSTTAPRGIESSK
jgi:hypothetical protein